jgi:exopolysaccharide biosynthesis polyprenyl glycosylphosphotransferase
VSESKALEVPVSGGALPASEKRPVRPAGWTWTDRGAAVGGTLIARPVWRDAFLRRALALADVIACGGALAIFGAVYGHGVDLPGVLAAFAIVPIAKMMGRYDRDELLLRKSTLDEFPRLLALACAFVLVWTVLVMLLTVRPHSEAGQIAFLWAVNAALLTLSRETARALVRGSAPAERAMIIGNARPRQRLAHSLASDPGARIEIVGFMPLEDERRADLGVDIERRRSARRLQDLAQIVEELEVERVFIALSNHDGDTMLDVISLAVAAGVKISIVPSLMEVVGSAVEFDHVGGVTLLGLRRPGLSRSSRVIKRTADVIGSGLLLLMLSPVLAATAIAIRLDSDGPVFFSQLRVGRYGKAFRIIKFRSMLDGAESQRAALESLNESVGLFKMTSDPRVTRIGRLIRKASIDELPQLFNVLRGDMSLVGPRPLIPEEDALIEGHHRSRLQLAPGMTGPWQVLGPSRPPLAEMAKTDYLYAANWSLWSDIKIMLRTVAHVGSRRGT